MNSRTVRVAPIDDLAEGEPRVYQVGELFIVLCRVKGEVFALEDRCTHDDGPLASGCLHGYQLECPRHGARFDIRDGSICRMPAYGDVPTFRAITDGTDVLVELPAE
jgi:3-phenylpropionate/trans-cinnamate dioxygenase ferredoxin subunit